MELATALHHSAQLPKSRVVERTEGTSPTEAPWCPDAEAQEAAVTVGYVAAAAPLLAQPVLGGGDTLGHGGCAVPPGAVSPRAPEGGGEEEGRPKEELEVLHALRRGPPRSPARSMC